MNHKINSAGDCSCGQDGVSCQLCGKRFCGSLTTWMEPVPGKKFNGNVCPGCKPAVGCDGVLDELKVLSDRLQSLLANPQPGLASWNKMLSSVINKISEFQNF